MARRPDPERLAVWQSFTEAHARVTTKLARELDDETDLPLTWFEVLGQLIDANGRLRMQELAQRTVMNKSSLTRVVDRLEDEGFVEREACADDGRGQFAVLTREGRAAYRSAQPSHLHAVQREFAQHLTDSDVVALQRVLAKLNGDRQTV
jgi:DNA-binding MarR family transcriptional regulator